MTFHDFAKLFLKTLQGFIETNNSHFPNNLNRILFCEFTMLTFKILNTREFTLQVKDVNLNLIFFVSNIKKGDNSGKNI